MKDARIFLIVLYSLVLSVVVFYFNWNPTTALISAVSGYFLGRIVSTKGDEK